MGASAGVRTGVTQRLAVDCFSQPSHPLPLPGGLLILLKLNKKITKNK
jgi:hypothetical protein